jgi:PPK2 family polyphosphate:nucleotide phosphotransferase
VKLPKKVIEELRVEPGRAARLADRSTRSTRATWLDAHAHASPKDIAEHELAAFTAELAAAQELLFATDAFSVLVIVQALDAAGKDGTIKHVMSGVNPQGCEVVSFKEPSATERSHDFLWRCAVALPERGRIGIFNRSYYEEVLVTRVHPELLDAEHLAPGTARGDALWKERHEDINAFERHLHRNGTRVVKLFLHVSEEEQRKRLLARLEDPAKYWKFSPSDLAERAHFGEYQRAYEETLTATSTADAPWYVVPADHKYLLRALAGGVLAHVIGGLDLRLPEVDGDRLAELERARAQLEAEAPDG